MVLKPFIASKDEVAEAVRAEYTEGDDGRFYLDVEQLEGYSLEHVGTLKSTLAKNKRTIAEYKLKLEASGELSDEVKAQLEELKLLQEKGGEGDEKHQSQIRQLSEKHESELKKYKEQLDERNVRIDTLGDVIKEELITGSAQTALIGAGITPEGASMLLPHIVGRMKVTESEDGEFSVVVFDAKGEEMITSKRGSMENADVDELVETFRKDKKFSLAWAGSGKSGGGAGGGDDRTPSGKNPWAKEHLNLTKQTDISAENPELAKKLMADAGVG